MTDATHIAQMERRIADAMDRIRAGIEQVGSGSAAASEAEALRQQLQTTQTARAALDAELAALRGAAEKQVRQMQVLDTALQQLRAANDQLRANNAKLRDANRAGVGDASLINAGMEAELKAVSAAHAADRAEAQAIIAAMQPLIGAADS